MGVRVSKTNRGSPGLDRAAWLALLEAVGLSAAAEGEPLQHRAPLQHAADLPPLYLHCRADGTTWFSTLRAEAARFDTALWRRIAAPRRGERQAHRLNLVPHAGCEAAALHWLVGMQTDDDAALLLQRREDLEPNQRGALLAARLGQGVFRHAIEQHERSCRLTGLLDRRHLRAVHIKPWRLCSDAEKLDGYNGLLLSPHVAHLFEAGGLTFTEAGELLLSRQLNPAVVKSWHLQASVPVGQWLDAQRPYLQWHRQQVFESERRPWPRPADS